jgi:two-component sensor histidine kinase/AmiR/NasT family two-component response regulator
MNSLHNQNENFNLDIDYRNSTILITDDNPTNLRIIVEYLNNTDLTILVSQDGESTLKRAKYAHPDLILLDILMPGINGYETCDRLKADPETKDIPVIFMTALSNIEDKVKGFEVGAVDYITKPFQPEEVLARIKLHLKLRYLTKTLEAQSQFLDKHNKLLQTEINNRIQAEKKLKQFNEQLENIVENRTIQLKKNNRQLEQEILERKQAEEKLKTSLKEKEILLKEIHHRVKNNLLVVSTLLEFQADYIKNPEIVKLFNNSQQRIQSMALIHEHLYGSTNLAKLNFTQYIEDLVNKVSECYYVGQQGIQIHLNAEPIHLNIETANPCGLIINELIANAFEHAFPNHRKGDIWLSLHQEQDNNISLTIRDNGIGLPENFDFRNSESLGLQLVCTLVDQLEGTIEFEEVNGTSFQITFTELNYSSRV